jgi:pimeloyl-ACP methyl ester carboxylesterase
MTEPAPTTRFGRLTGVEIVPGGNLRRPVLFVHGWWGGAWVWDRFMTQFAAAGYPCFAINLRGYHGSGGGVDIESVSFDDHVADIAHAVTVLGDPILVTHSAAGHFALKLGETRKVPAVIHLVPTAPAGVLSWTTTRVFLRYMPRLLRGRPILLDKADMIAADLNRLPAAEQDSVFARMVPAPGKQGRQMLYARVDADRLRGPRLIVTGTDDRLVPPSVHHTMAKKYGCHIREYPNHAHYLLREPGWQVIADDCLAWLNSELLR